MGTDRPVLRLIARHDAWSGAAWRGLLHDVAEPEDVLVQLGPPQAGPRFVESAREQARQLAALRQPGVLRLRAVMEHDRRVAWVYEWFDGVALLNVAGDAWDTVVPARVAAELVAAVVDIVRELPGPVRHPGPEDWDVLVDEKGTVKLAGFVGPTPRSARLFAPFGDTGDAALVFRLGVYLGTLLSGAPPGQATDEHGHAATVRRTLVRAMSRPRVELSDSLGDCLRSMLAWDPDDRPALDDLAARLRAAIDITQPGLGGWCAAHIGSVRRAARNDASILRRETPSTPEVLEEHDDFTAVEEPTSVAGADPASAGIPPDETVQTHRRALDSLERGPNALFPVKVGPPPEIVIKRPMLPDGFLEGGAAHEPTHAATSSVPRPNTWPIIAGVALGLMLVLSMAALTLLMTTGSDPVPMEQPRMADVLPAPSEAGELFDLTVLVRGGEPFRVSCDGGVQAEGREEVRLTRARAGRCQLSGMLDGQRVLVPFEVSGPGTVRCFQTGQPQCR